jgi:hypothetical protein
MPTMDTRRNEAATTATRARCTTHDLPAGRSTPGETARWFYQPRLNHRSSVAPRSVIGRSSGAHQPLVSVGGTGRIAYDATPAAGNRPHSHAEVTVARAKQTARAEARRRHRLATRPLDAEPEDVAPEGEDAAPTPRGTEARRAQAKTSTSGRPSFFGSFRAAYRRPDIRADLIALPGLLRGWPFLAAIGIILAGAAIFSVFPGYSLADLAFQFMTLPPAYAPIFFIGFFAPRATYLLGAVVGVIDAAVYALLILTVFPRLGGAPDQSSLPVYIGAALFWSVLTGTFFAGGIAWYRRFLALTSPRRTAPAGRQAKAKAGGSAPRRRF